MLDATKAFDRVEYCKLFRQLMLRKIPPIIIRLLLNMYVNHTTHVAWNGIFSERFSVRNGVKQGGILSPVLFCIYFDGLLSELSKAGIGCFMGSFFVGALAYADDLVLLAPTPHAMRLMLSICDKYASNYEVLFNAKKSKCLIISPNGSVSRNNNLVSFQVGGEIIELVDEWPHLGHIITQTLSDEADILNRRNSMIGQINNVLCYFSKLDSVTKVRLLKTYCSSFYGCELWDLWNDGIEVFARAWRNGQRAVWKLPRNTHTRYLHLLCESIPVEDEICKRFLSFTCKCLVSECALVRFVARYGLCYGGMASLCGRNALFCARRYCCSVIDVCNSHFNNKIVSERCNAARSMDDIALVSLLAEAIFVRDGIFTVDFSNDNCLLTQSDINDIIYTICTT
jgi:hypothetical protein